ncbi:hypothetical protein [Mammaliicoccus sciuri]|uniref:hypothetical protein n=1 Tax=Mammaliicoccus sciuri TaxID=1296 RepID=UPI001F1D5CF3|nr:hypothetical protein [Mammaliicoccus sciuri]MCE5086341.1 hypothetical protein [Mammaliicoccus sciuri]
MNKFKEIAGTVISLLTLSFIIICFREVRLYRRKQIELIPLKLKYIELRTNHKINRQYDVDNMSIKELVSINKQLDDEMRAV